MKRKQTSVPAMTSDGHDLAARMDMSAGPGGFARGDALVSKLPCFTDDPAMNALYEDLVQPVIIDLVAEFGAPTASARILIELAAHSYVDARVAQRASRRMAAKDRDASAATAAERAAKRAERSLRLTLECLDALRRPTPASVRVAISEARSVHVGDQVVALDAGAKKDW